jgi:phosphatidylglycerophosphate synthase
MTTAVIVIDRATEQMRFLGLNLVERAALRAARAGIRRVHLVGEGAPDGDVVWRLRRRGLIVTCAYMKDGVFETAPQTGRLIVIPTDLIVEPRTQYQARISPNADVAAIEREYLRRANGGDTESISTRIVRKLSVPLTRQLVKLPINANQVTLAGFALALLAGWAFSFGGYGWGIAGALFYYASMILDCSDGEVARAKLIDSRFGAWLETATDYLSYFAVLGGIVWGDIAREGFCRHAQAALIAAPASLAIIALVAYQRARVARSNPGAFDDALAAQLAQGSDMHRFSVWARQLIKRSFLAHLILFQAVIGFLPALLEIWAIGAVAALAVVLAVHTYLVNNVQVEPLAAA